jgi:HK97 family phage prohead protease
MTACETRALPSSSIEVRESGGSGRPKLVGWAAIWNSRSVDLGGFKEIVRPNCFKDSLAEGADVRALIDHDVRLIIGRNKAATLVVGEDERGLRFEINPPDTQVARDLVENVRAGNITGASFAFRVRPGGERWDMQTNPPTRELLAVDLFDVSPCAMPAYLRTEVDVRSLRTAEGNTAVHAAVLAELEAASEASRRLASGLVQRRATGEWARWFRDDHGRRAYIDGLAARARRVTPAGRRERLRAIDDELRAARRRRLAMLTNAFGGAA